MHLRRACLALTLSVALAAGVAAPANAGLPSPVKQPREVEEFSGYFPQVSCSPVAQRGVVKLRNLALKTYGRGYDGGMTRSCVQGGSSEHKEGRAWDWMLNVKNRGDRRAANNFLSWLTAKGPDGEAGYQARSLGIMYVIWNRRIWSAYRSQDGWRRYSGYSPHTDHIHLSFNWAGARGRTSFWTGRTAGTDYGRCALFAGQPAVLAWRTRHIECRSPEPQVRRSSRAIQQLGSTNARAMKTAQSRLRIHQTGRFDTRTWRAVKRYQTNHDLPRTGALDKPTWASLVPRDRTWQATRGYNPARAAHYGARHFTDEVLSRRSVGREVLFLQTALRMGSRLRNGYFGPKTAARVRHFKVRNGLAHNARVTEAVWQKLDARR